MRMANRRMKNAAKFVEDLEFSRLGESTVHQTKRCVLDFMGAILGGAKTRAGEISLKVARDFEGLEEATILPTSDRVSCQFASFVHGTMGSALDIDDGHRLAVGHPGGVVIPAALAVAENINSTGKEFLEAVVCGYEVAIRAGQVLRSKFPLPISMGSGRWGSVGAAAAVAKLLRLNLERTKQALAISATFAPVAPVTDDLKKRGFIPMTKFSSGWGALVGICSAQLAKGGFTGISSAIDLSSSSLPHFEEYYEIENVYFKPYPSCRWTHAAIEGTIHLMREHGNLKKETIRSIQVRTFSRAADLNEPRPPTMESASYSIPFLVGAAVVDGEVGIDQITEERLSDSDVLNVADKVRIVCTPEFDRCFPGMIASEVEIETVSGLRYKTRVTRPKGDPQNPLSDKELVDKFKRLAKESISPETAKRVIGAVEILERQSSMACFTSTFQKGGMC